MDKDNDKKIKNLISLVILLAGLFIGSLFVDVSQFIKGSGYSAKNLNESDIFEADGKTWVAYSEPAVSVSVITDDNCEQCDPGEALAWLRKVLPTISTEKVIFDSERGKELISQFGIKILPAFIFSSSIEKTEFYTQAQVLFEPKDSRYALNMQELGIPAGKYLELPAVVEGDATLGKADSNVKVIVYMDFQCPYCKVFYSTLRNAMKDYRDKVLFDFKELPLDIHAQANDAALASKCALEQNKFWEYADKLYAGQSEWGNAQNNVFFKNYAKALGLNANEFNQCLDDKKYQDKIDKERNEAQSFGVSGTPFIFINDQVETGMITADQLKKDIDAQLNK